MDTGKQLALLVTCTLRIALSERKEPWSSIMVELQTEKKTEWKMNEYKALDGEASSSTGAGPLVMRQEFSLCRVYKKSKCLQAFDRRPPPEVVIGEPSIIRAQQAEHHHEEATTLISHQIHQNPQYMVDRTSSLDSSSSGDHHLGGLTSQIGESSNNMASMDASTDGEPFWDLDQLDWSFGSR
ncbi:hypothetical protein LWI28_018883 [Acer negundo]|uniref:Uncharacterized protein n=1 Tax=Acer negundo TaxID=4023 RepID=A0AAD5NF23_ACENE|nr:hypothetical protein LWI28_018883 [Acer negundo]